MGVCDTCGNSYESTFRIVLKGNPYEFDCFECAIQKLAPACGHCGCRIIGQGVEEGGSIFCGNHCLRAGEKKFVTQVMSSSTEQKVERLRGHNAR